MILLKNKIYICQIFEFLEKRKINLTSLHAQDNFLSSVEGKPALIKMYKDKGGFITNSVIKKAYEIGNSYFSSYFKKFNISRQEILYKFARYDDYIPIYDACNHDYIDIMIFFYNLSGERYIKGIIENKIIEKNNESLLNFFYERKIITNLQTCKKLSLINDYNQVLKFYCKKTKVNTDEIRSMYHRAEEHNSIKCMEYITSKTIPREYILDFEEL